MADQTPSSQDYNNSEAAKWDSTRDAYLVEQLLYHERIGRRPHSVWSKEAWRETCAAFNLKFGTSYSIKVFKNRLTKLKDQFNTLKKLTREKGFHWDDHYHMVAAENTVWDDYIMRNPKAKHFRGKAFPLQDQLGLMFEGLSTEAKDVIYTRRRKRVVQKTNQTDNGQITSPRTPKVAKKDNYIVPSSEDETSLEQPIRNRIRTPPFSNTRGVKRQNENPADKLINLLMEFLDKQRGSSYVSRTEQSSTMIEGYTYAECLQELKRIDEFDVSEIVRGAHALKDEQNRVAFMTLEGPSRVAFIRSCFS